MLEASYIVRLVAPYHRNFGKRLVKAPKLYFLDTGLASALVGIHEARALAIHPMRGALFETWVLGELFKYGFNRGQVAELYFWRDSSGNEVDVLAERGNRIHALEIKSGQTIAGDFFAGLERFSRVAGAARRTLIYGGEQTQERSAAMIFGWRGITAVAQRLFG